MSNESKDTSPFYPGINNEERIKRTCRLILEHSSNDVEKFYAQNLLDNFDSEDKAYKQMQGLFLFLVHLATGCPMFMSEVNLQILSDQIGVEPEQLEKFMTKEVRDFRAKLDYEKMPKH